jgi:hypothetical protein
METLQLEMDPLYENQVMNVSWVVFNMAIKNIKYSRSDKEWFIYYGKLYLFYVDAYNALEECYD